MTPPFERLSGRSAPSFHISRDEDTEATRIVLPPDASALEMIAGLNDRISSAVTDQELSRILPEEGEVTSEALQEALDWSLTQARDGNPRMYVTFTRLIAGIIQGIPSENRASMREQIVGLVPEAIEALQHAEMPSRDRVTRIYELTMAVAGTMTRTTREAPSEEETAALLSLFTAVRDAIHQHLEACESNPELRPNPDYMLPFCEAQIAMLNGDSETALRNLLETRRIIAELPESSTLGIRQQIQISAELAIQALPRDNAGLAADTFRSRVGLELLSYFYQVDGIATAGESGSADVERNSRDFNLISGLAEDFGIAIDEDEQEFGDEERQALVQLLETQYTKNEAFQEVIDHLELGDMESAEDRAEIWGHLIDHAETVYAHIHDHREAEPYQSVLAWSNEHDRLASLTTALEEHEELRNALAELVGLSGEAPADGIARSLIEFGPLLPTLIEALPEAIRNDDANDATLDALRTAANGFNEDGMRSNVTEPMESLFEILSGLSVSQPNYSSAYAALYHGLAEMEEIIPDVEFPEALRTRAREELTEAESFSWRRVFNHLTEPESLAMIIGGAVFTEGISGWMLTRAGTAGEWGALVRGGSLTWRGEAAVGMGVALGMSTFGTISHVARSDRPVGETLSEILPGVALGTLLSGVALGGTMLVGRGLRGALMSESRAASRLSLVGLRGGNILAGGTLMLAANGLTRGIISGRWEMPGAEEAAETYLMMAAFDLAAAGFRRVGSRFWWRRQLGPMRARAVEELAGRIHRADASIDEAAMRNYLGMRVARGRSLADIEAALAEGLVPTVEGSGSGRTLTFRRGGSGTVRALSPAARAISSSPEFQTMMQQLHRVVVERLLNTPGTDRVYLEVTHNEELLIRVLDSGAARNPENSFAMGPDSVPVEFEAITDPVTRDVLREYGRELHESGRVELRNRMFESARRQRRATGRIGSGSSPRPEMSRTEAARVILDLSPADQALMNEIFASDAFQNNWQRLMRSVRATLRNRGDEATTWVVARRNGRTVRFNVEDSEPTIETGEVTFRVDRIGRITGMGEGDSIIRALVQRIPQSTLLPSSTGADVGRRESEDGETRAHRTGGSSREPTRPFQVERDGSRSERRPTEEREADPVDDEDVEEISDETHEAEPETPIEEIAVTTLRAPPIPRESRRMPPALPGPDARTPETPRPSPRPAVTGAIDEGETAGFSIGGILEGAELASAIDQLIVAADAHPDTGTLFVEINPRPGEPLFRIVNIAGFRTHPDRGYFVLNRLTNRASSGTSSSYVLEGDPLLPATLSDTNLGELLRQQFQR